MGLWPLTSIVLSFFSSLNIFQSWKLERFNEDKCMLCLSRLNFYVVTTKNIVDCASRFVRFFIEYILYNAFSLPFYSVWFLKFLKHEF